MTIVVIILIAIVIIIDFIKLKKDDKGTVYVYISIVALTALVYTVSKFQVFKLSPLELFIEGMKPITTWVENALK